MKKIFKYYLFILVSIILISAKHTDENLESHKILILHSYHAGLTWVDTITEGIIDYFDAQGIDNEYYIEYMDTKRNTGSEYMEYFMDFYHEKNHSIDFDGIIICDNNALSLFISKREEYFKDIPAVFCGINHFSKTILNGEKNITGVQELMQLQSNIELIIQVNPLVREIVIINDNKTTTSIENQKLVDEFLENYDTDIEFTFWRDKTFAEVYRDVELLNPQTSVLVLTYFIDGNGEYRSNTEFIRDLSKCSSVPVYGPWKFYLNEGITGGYMTEGYLHGSLTASIMGRILNGESADSIPIIKDNNQTAYFDYYQLRKFNISESDLPKNAVIVNKPKGFFDKYRKLILLVLSSLAGLSIILFLYLIFQRMKQVELKNQNKLLNEIVHKRTKELKNSNESKNQILSIVAHDLRSPLGSLKSLTALYEGYSSIEPKDQKEYLNNLRDKLIHIGDDFDTILNWAHYQMEGIVPNYSYIELKKMVEVICLALKEKFNEKGISADIRLTSQNIVYSDINILRTIVRNLMSNALKFSPRNSSIELNYIKKNNKTILSIKDHGQGMNKELIGKIYNKESVESVKGTEAELGTGIGLSLCMQLVGYVDGEIIFNSKEGEGTDVSIILMDKM